MKYQIYLQKDVSDIINAISQGLGKKPTTLIKELLESNFRTAFVGASEMLLERGVKPSNEQQKTKQVTK